mmetsp:Transcript_18485/g.62365  ORF Transcript_18485/g.62365 Transcript_18485/m.62365 type:complete len:219 (+) Transcript_18485:248-904(+)
MVKTSMSPIERGPRLRVRPRRRIAISWYACQSRGGASFPPSCCDAYGLQADCVRYACEARFRPFRKAPPLGDCGCSLGFRVLQQKCSALLCCATARGAWSGCCATFRACATTPSRIAAVSIATRIPLSASNVSGEPSAAMRTRHSSTPASRYATYACTKPEALKRGRQTGVQLSACAKTDFCDATKFARRRTSVECSREAKSRGCSAATSLSPSSTKA